MINKDKLKELLTIDQIIDLLADLGAEPQKKGEVLICKTICHNPIGEGSHKLYYYENTKLFKCFTSCDQTFDIFELIIKVFKIRNNIDLSLPQAMSYILSYFGLGNWFIEEDIPKDKLKDWDIFSSEEKQIKTKEKKQVDFKVYDNNILRYLPQPRILPWENEGINYEVIKYNNIKYDPVMHAVVIPHYDINNNLIGIRERTLVKEEEQNGKYKPAILNNVMYNHPLGFNLYNINNAKTPIQNLKKAIIAEGEKAALQYGSFFGIENNICVACCGSNIIEYQISLLLNLGVQEIIIALDKQFQEIGDMEWQYLTQNLTNIYIKYGKYVQISFLFDKSDLLKYKESPFDEGKEIFLQLFKERVFL